MKRFSLCLSVLSWCSTQAQFGPGGVGAAANNVLWLSGDNGVVVAGTAVTNWNDRSGNPNNAASPSVAARPTLIPGALNNYPIISFDGVNDELRVPDAGSLDLQQWDLFFVGADAAPKNNNAWLTKGTSTQPNYGLWSTSTDAMRLPVYDILTLFSNPTTANLATGPSYNFFEYTNTFVFFIFSSRTLNKNGSTFYTDAGPNILQFPATNANPLYIGNAQGAVGWNLNGGISEIIAYNSPINSAQRIIVNNYLSAKYNLPLTSNDLYLQDNFANGDYDHEVAGIGRISSTSLHTDSRGSAVVRINNASSLGNNEFLIWGHNNGVLGSWGSTDLPPGVQGRWFRVWRVNEVSQAGAAIDVGNVDMTFDLVNQGPVTVSDLRLLVDINNNGIFADDAPIAGAVAAGGTLYRFPAVSQLVNNRRFTLGTINSGNTPLPIELISFTAQVENDHTVRLDWSTAAEHDNDHFTVERAQNAVEWDDVVHVPAAGNSTSVMNYSARDHYPLPQLSYYRLRQTDTDGSITHSNAVAVRIDRAANELLIYPDPAHDLVNVEVHPLPDNIAVQLYNDLGQVVKAPVVIEQGSARIDVSALAPGGYVVTVLTDNQVLQKHLLVAH
ncbi:MAG: T9SS type A sorting domain-containing protein [Flavobacteriales bacterium]